MKVLLISHDFDREIPNRKAFLYDAYPMYGLNLLATVLRGHGHEVIVLDRFYHELCNEKEEEMSFEKRIRTIIETKGIDVVGITVMSDFRHQCFGYAGLVKKLGVKLGKDIKVVVGGPHVTALAEQVIKYYHADIDAAVIGEGEETLPELISAWQEQRNLKEVKGIVFWDMNINQPVHTEPRPPLKLNKLPHPDYDQYGKFKAAMLHGGRGCSYGKCEFCFPNSVLWGKPRFRSTKHILAEIDHLVHEHEVATLRIWDDDFLAFGKRALEVFNGIQERGYKLKLYLEARFDSVTKELLEEFKKAGGQAIYLGLESGSENLREKMNKRLPQQTVYEVSRLVKDVGLNLGYYLMLGYPGETDKDIEETWRVLRETQPDEISCSLIRHYPGTPLYNKAVAEETISDDNWVFESKPTFFCTPDDRVEVLKEIQKAMVQFSTKIIRPSYEWDDKAFAYIYGEGDKEESDLLILNELPTWDFILGTILSIVERHFGFKYDAESFDTTDGENLMGVLWIVDPTIDLSNPEEHGVNAYFSFGWKGDRMEKNINRIMRQEKVETRKGEGYITQVNLFFGEAVKVGSPLIIRLVKSLCRGNNYDLTVVSLHSKAEKSDLSIRKKIISDALKRAYTDIVNEDVGIVQNASTNGSQIEEGMHKRLENFCDENQLEAITGAIDRIKSFAVVTGDLSNLRKIYDICQRSKLPLKDKLPLLSFFKRAASLAENVLLLKYVYGKEGEEIFGKIINVITGTPFYFDSFSKPHLVEGVLGISYRPFLFYDLTEVEDNWELKYRDEIFSSKESVKNVPSKYMIISTLNYCGENIGFISIGFGKKEDSNKVSIFNRQDECTIEKINKFILEVSKLASGIVSSATREEAAKKERLRFLYKQAKDIAHDIRMPQKIKNIFDELIKGVADTNMKNMLMEIQNYWTREVGERINRIIRISRTVGEEMLLFPLNINASIKEAIEKILDSPDFDRDFLERIEFKCDLAENLPEVMVDREILKVFRHIFTNSLQQFQSKEGFTRGRIEVKTDLGTGSVIIRIKDDGGGIPDEKMFEPGYSTKGSPGNGLPTCRETIKRYGGHIGFDSDGDDKGIAFRIVLKPILRSDNDGKENHSLSRR